LTAPLAPGEAPRLMRLRRDLRRRLSLLAAAAVLGLALRPGAAGAQAPDAGAASALFKQRCATCHANPTERTPTQDALKAMSPSFIVDALSHGMMRAQGSGLTDDERTALAEYLTGRKLGVETPMAGKCAAASPPLSLDGPMFNGWGANVENWRFQPDPGLTADDLPRLELKWAFGVPGAILMFGQPTVAAGRVFIGGQNGHVYALDMRTGCYFWDYRASTGVRTAITVARVGGRMVALFADRRAHVYSVDATTGETIWKAAPDVETGASNTGAPVLFENRLYVPIANADGASAGNSSYECCKGSGAVIALDAATGDVVWKTYTTAEPAPQGRNAAGTQLYGPSGASIWAAPTIDAGKRLLYVGTGDNHSAPATDTSDAVLALNLDDGKIVWSKQLLPGDIWNGACGYADHTNCPEPHGPDQDIGSSANLIGLGGGKRVLAVGQKSGMVWGLDPDDGGKIVWSMRVGEGGRLGGVQWGTATDGKAVFVAVSDIRSRPGGPDPQAGGGLFALAAADGAVLWRAPPPDACGAMPDCSPAQSAAVTATPGFVLSGSDDSHIRAYSVADGRVLWDYDMARPFMTVNDVEASGGALDGAGPTVAGGMIFVNAGYGLYGKRPGNVLAAFAPKP
jgi:polyvinyl alcohol dehydrogenase (cytochrome)